MKIIKKTLRIKKRESLLENFRFEDEDDNEYEIFFTLSSART